MRWILACFAAFTVGCATTRKITISARPTDARIAIDGTDRGRGPITETFVFKDDQIHEVSASRLGHASRAVVLTRQFDRPELMFDLPPRMKQITIHVMPLPARIQIDGQAVSGSALQDYTTTLPFTVNDRNEWTRHVIQASRPGVQTAERVLRWEDTEPTYSLVLDSMRKDLAVTTTPAGAEVSIDGRSLGKAPVTARRIAFPADPKTGKYIPQKLTVTKPGYDPVSTTISWDNGRESYRVDLVPKTKAVRITTDPPGAAVTIDGREMPRGQSGESTATLVFPPIDEQGTLRTCKAVVAKKTADSEWIPQELTIEWDNGKSDYSVSLQEVKTRPVSLLRAKAARTDEGWQIVPETIETLAMKDVTEGPTAEPPVRITDLPRGTVIDTLCVSPDGQQLLFTTLSSTTRADFRSQLHMVRTDGSGAPTLFGDGKTLDLAPSFTPDGTQVVFASNRGGRHLSIWQMAASGEGGVTQLTSGDTTDLWPTVDSDPKPRLFYEAMVDSRPDPRIYLTTLSTTLRTDLTQTGGEQPRVSPKADSVVFTLINDKTGKRDIYRMSDRGGGAVNLTNSTDSDNFDPVWSKDGSRIAFTSDRGVDADGRHNYDIWVLDLTHPDKPVRITANGSWDDRPAWDPEGKYVYFRSNRGGNWGIWRLATK